MFPSTTLQNSQNILSEIINRGGKILYDHYLTTKLPNHTNSQNYIMLENVIDNQVKIFDQEYGMKNDFQSRKISRDNFHAKSIQVKKVFVHKETQLPDSPTLKLKKFNRISSKSTKRDDTSVRISNTQNLRKKAEAPISLQPSKQYTEKQLSQLWEEDTLRKKKAVQQQVQRATLRTKKQRQLELQTQRKLMKMQLDDIQSKNQNYTYDFQGKFVRCMHQNTDFLNHNFNPNMKIAVSDHNRAKLEKKDSKINKKQATNTSEIHRRFSETVSLIKSSKQSKILQKYGTDPIKNEIFNNNNSRQMSNINYIQLAEGSKIFELDNQNILSNDKKNTLNKKQFTDQNLETKFKPFFKYDVKKSRKQSQDIENKSYQLEKVSPKNEFLATSTKIPSSMGIRTRKSTLLHNLFKLDLNNKPLTAGNMSFRQKSQLLRPKSTKTGKEKVIVANTTMLQRLYQL